MDHEKKKLCIIINGSLRFNNDVIINSIERCKKLFEWADPDIWLFTWKLEDGREKELEKHCYKLIADEFSPTDEQLDGLGIPYCGCLRTWPEHKICRISNYSCSYGMDYAFNKIIQSGEKYEYAFKMRNDLVLEADTESWVKIADENPSWYITPDNFWARGHGINDHVGFGKFDTVRDAWSFGLDEFKKYYYDAWNAETYLKNKIDRMSLPHHMVGVNKYIIIRVGRLDESPRPDWVFV
jgi:hypothetical protein